MSYYVEVMGLALFRFASEEARLRFIAAIIVPVAGDLLTYEHDDTFDDPDVAANEVLINVIRVP